MDDFLSSWEHHKWVVMWKLIPIKPNWCIIHSVDYQDRYIFSFFNYQKFERVLWNRQYHLRWGKEYRKTCSISSVNISGTGLYVVETGQVFHWWAFTGGKQRWNISCWGIPLAEKSLSAQAKRSIKRLLGIIICKRLSDSWIALQFRGCSHCWKCGISNTLATNLLTRGFVGPGTFQAGLELYELAVPAGLYLIKLKIGHWVLGLVPSGKMLLPGSMLTQICIAIWCH